MTDLMEQLNILKGLAEDATMDAAKFDNGDNTAGVRVRKAMQNIKKVAQEIRQTVQREIRRNRID